MFIPVKVCFTVNSQDLKTIASTNVGLVRYFHDKLEEHDLDVEEVFSGLDLDYDRETSEIQTFIELNFEIEHQYAWIVYTAIQDYTTGDEEYNWNEYIHDKTLWLQYPPPESNDANDMLHWLSAKQDVMQQQINSIAENMGVVEDDSLELLKSFHGLVNQQQVIHATIEKGGMYMLPKIFAAYNQAFAELGIEVDTTEFVSVN